MTRVYYAMCPGAGCRERDAWAPHTQTHHTNARCAAMMIRPYKPRDSARSALLAAVRVADVRRSGLAVHPRREGTTYTALRRDSAMPGPLTPRSYLIYLLSCDKIDTIGSIPTLRSGRYPSGVHGKARIVGYVLQSAAPTGPSP